MTPVNEAAMATFRSAIVSCLTFVATRRAVYLTFATATKGNDVDHDIAVVCRRSIAARRAVAKDKEAKKLMEEILKCYEDNNEPGIYRNDHELSTKGPAGEPTNPRRAKMRKACRPQ